MKKSDLLLWTIVILIAGFAFWAIYTGKLNSFSGSFIDGIWRSIENLIRPIFSR